MFGNRIVLFVLLAAQIAGVPSFAQQPSESGVTAAQLAGRWKLVSLDAVSGDQIQPAISVMTRAGLCLCRLCVKTASNCHNQA